jgi:hypothetical protein
VRFPDARIEFEDRDRQEQHRDIEVVTPHYRGAQRGGRCPLGVPELSRRAPSANQWTAWRPRPRSTAGRGDHGVTA